MKIAFRKETAVSHPTLLFCWQMQLEGDGETAVSDLFIPELYFDFFFIQRGQIGWRVGGGQFTPLPQQFLKTLQNRPLTFKLSLPLTVYGARFALAFADHSRQLLARPNRFLPTSWLSHDVENLAAFMKQLGTIIDTVSLPKPRPALLSSRLEESKNLAAYSPRHKRRLIKARYGLSLKEMEAIEQIQQFLRQGCNFDNRMPRIIEYVHNDFYDQPHLNKAFKKVTGLSPLAYFDIPSLLQDNLMAVSYNETAVF